MSLDPTFVLFSTSDGQCLNVNRYYLQIFNKFYRDLLKLHADVLDQLIFIHESLSLDDLQRLVKDIHTKHEDCETYRLKQHRKCDSSFNKTVKEIVVEQSNVKEHKKDNESLNERNNELIENHSALKTSLKCPYCPKSDKNKEWKADNLFAHLHIKHCKELETTYSISFETFMTKLRRSVSNRCALGCVIDIKACNLVEHYKWKHIEDPVVCDNCGQSFQNKLKLNCHSRVAHGPSVVCQICSKVCGNLFKLKFHTRNVHCEKNVSCTYQNCTMSFADKMQRKKHITLAHEKVKPFRCDVCGISMSKFTNLREHRGKVHKIEKYSSIKHYREIISSGKHPFIEKDSPLANAIFI